MKANNINGHSAINNLNLDGVTHVFAANDWSPGRGMRPVRYVRVEPVSSGRFQEPARYIVSANQGGR